METLWRSEVFTADDFRVFKYQPNPAIGVADNVPDFTAFHTNTRLLKEKDQENWLPRTSKSKTDDLNEWLITASPTIKTGEYFALLLPRMPPPKRPTRFPDIVNTTVLKSLPFSQASFSSIVKKLSVHHAFAVIVDRGVPIISRTQSAINGNNCYIYTLRVEHTLKDQSAMSITHFREAPPTPQSSHTPSRGTANGTPPPQRPTSETYAIILGYKNADIASLQKCLQNCKESIFNPFTLIKAFLGIERGHRFTEVNRKIVDFQNILQNYGRLPFGADGSRQPQGGGKGNEQDPKNLIGLYLEIYTLKIRLMAWCTQIAGLKKYTSDFLSLTADRPDIEPEEYLQRMLDEYEVKINKCEMVLQGASLAFQMETAHLARLDSARSIKIAEYARADSVRSIQIAELSRLDSLNAMRDGKQMKAIALLTMVFLPGTFIATVLAVPVFESIKDTTRFKPWAWYPICFVPLTVVVLAVYFVWITYYKSESQKEVDKYKIYRPEGMEAVSLTTVGKV